jgi:transcriptional regulator with XRE-family HTH domain
MARTKSLSRFLRAARETRGLSVAEVADRAGVAAMSVYNWEAGRSRPRSANLLALCKVLRVKPAEVQSMTGV